MATKNAEDIRPGDQRTKRVTVNDVTITAQQVLVTYLEGGSETFPRGSAVEVAEPADG
jgi:hypothetical protein